MRCWTTAAALLAGLCALLALSAAEAQVPVGTLRATYIGQNPVQAFVDPISQELRGPGAEITRALAQRLGLPYTLKGAQGVAGVIASVKSGEADLGFVAFDPIRAADVDFSQTYSLAQNTYLVLDDSPLRSVDDMDREGLRLGVAESDAGDYFLTRTLQHATLTRNPGGNLAVAVDRLKTREIDAYAANRQRLTELVAKTSGLRIVSGNFYGVEQAVIVRKGNRILLEVIDKLLDEARTSGLIADSIARAGLSGVDVAPPREAQRR